MSAEAPEFLILAAGRSTRFGSDKLRVKVDGLTLPQRALLFAAENGATRVHVTVTDPGSADPGPLLADLHEVAPEGFDIRYRYQDPARYGTGAALLAWRGELKGPVVVLFGDNLYRGTLPQLPEATALYFTTTTRPPDPANARFAAVHGTTILEKPHTTIGGTFFTGFLRLPAGFLDTDLHLGPSQRGEWEITELVNAWPRRVAVPLEGTSVRWGELTYPEDLETLRS